VGFDLDMGTGRFWSAKVERIYCMTHGACFRPHDGICDAGPCVGEALERFAVRLDGEDALVEPGR
jgi:nitrite reductase/ring-hydroxylating ferredoxin subunit